MEFNNAPGTVMHIDFNSCFASIEQQANPLLRGKPIVVAAFATDRGCILAASVEAKRLGIKTGFRVMDGKKICPGLIVLPPDPWKYRNIHLKLRNLLLKYSPEVTPKSIDEFVMEVVNGEPWTVARDIKQKIKSDIGEWLTVSIGIATNRYLAKIAAGFHKPDGLDEINKDNFLNVYSKLKLTDLTGIKQRNAARLNSFGIYSVLDFYQAPVWKLKAAFHSIVGLYWHTRLTGYEIDDVEFERRSFGNSVAIGKNLSKIEEISPILSRLTEKMCSRLRTAGYRAGGVHLAIVYKNGSWWHKGRLTKDIYKGAFRLLLEANPSSPVLNLAVSCYGLSRNDSLQLNIFENVEKREDLEKSIDKLNQRWGDFTITRARSMGGAKMVMDRIAFGGVKELEELPSPLS